MSSTKQRPTTWNLAPLFASDDDPQIEEEKKKVEEESSKFVKKWRDRDDYLKEAKILKEALDEYENWARDFGTDGKFGFYFSLRTSQDQNDTTLRAKENKVVEFSHRIHNEMQFFVLRLGKVEESLQKKFLESSELEPYRHFLEKLFKNAKYDLSEAEEKILTLKSKTSYGNWVEMTSTLLSREEREVIGEDGDKKKIVFTQMSPLLMSKQKKVRDSAGKAVDDISGKLVEVAEMELNSILENKKIDDSLRGMERPDLARHLTDDMESEVVDSLIETVSKEFSISQDFYRLFTRLLGQEKLGYHERVVSFGRVEKSYSYEESVELVSRVFVKLDPEFAQIFREYVEEGQVDIFPRKGKRNGAFCATDLLTSPTYVMLNHTDRLQDVLTIAHEFGHAINYQLMRTKQNALNFGSPLSVTEVASTFMEDFVLEEILEEADDELRLSLMVMKLQEDVGTIFRQVALYGFEKELHQNFREKGYLSKEEIGEIFERNMAAYLGDSVDIYPEAVNWWVTWPHIRYFFYVYSYASGLLISKSLQASVKKDPKFISKVKDFLSAGESKSPKQIFTELGIDITDAKFWEQGLGETQKLLLEIEQLAKKLGKI